MTRDTTFLAEILKTRFYPQEVPLVSFTLHLSSFTRKQLYRRIVYGWFREIEKARSIP